MVATATLTVDRVTSARDLHEFIAFAWQVYARDPHWVPPLYFERLEFLDPRKNAFFRHAEADYFIARRGGRPVGTIAALVNHRHNEYQGENIAFFGFFEVLDDYPAAEALLQTALEWARARGYSALRGPAQFSTNDEVGLLVDGFDRPPMVLMTYNPPYYVGFLERAGFAKAMDLYAYFHTVAELGGRVEALPPKLLRVVEKIKARGEFTTRQVDLSQFPRELAHVKKMYNSAWERNWGFVPMDDAEIDRLAEGLRPILDPALVHLVEREGQPVGFGLSLPDVNYYLHRFRPGPSRLSSYLAVARLLLALRRRPPPGLRVFALGVLEPYRAHGVDALLYYETFRHAIPRGYQYGEMSWILENNVMMNRAVEFFGGRRYKTYRVYEKATG
jgi:GNAT superfamily N-acetyltransferase